MNHIYQKYNLWHWELWNSSIINNHNNLLSELENLRNDIKPIQSNKVLNVITEKGLEEYARRNLIQSKGGSLSKNTHCVVGTGTTGESPSDESLENEIGRKLITDMSSISGTEQYVTSWQSDEVSETDPKISEAGIYSNQWTQDSTTYDPILMLRSTTTSSFTVAVDNTLTITITSITSNGSHTQN